MTIFIILIILCLIYDPYIDISRNQIILWYGTKERKYKILWKNDY